MKKIATLLSVMMCIFAILLFPDVIIDEAATSQIKNYVCIVSEAPAESDSNDENSEEYGNVDKPKLPKYIPIYVICGINNKSDNRFNDYIKSIFNDSLKDLLKDWIKEHIKNFFKKDREGIKNEDNQKDKKIHKVKAKVKKKNKNNRR